MRAEENRGARRVGRLGLALAAALTVYVGLCSVAAAQPLQVVEGQQLSGQVATASVPTGCAPSTPSATITWGDSSPDSAATVTASGSQLLISGSHEYDVAGLYQGTVAGTYLCAGDHFQFSASFSVQVADAPLSVFAAHTLLAASDHSFSGGLGFFVDSASHAASGYSATINWGDGETSSATVTPCTDSTFCVGTFDVSGSHQYGLAAGRYQVTLTVTDDEGGAVAIGTDTIVVANQLQCPANLSWGGPYSGYEISHQYQLGTPQPVLDSGGNPTGQYSQTLWTGLIAAVTPGCWYAVGNAEAGSDPSAPTIHFLTYSGVSINGVYFLPESGDSVLVLGTDGTIAAENWCGLLTIKGVRAPTARAHDLGCSTSTYYDVEVPENGPLGGPLVTVGRVDLRAHPITDFNVSLAATDSIEPAANGPQIGSHVINPGATITVLPYPAQYAAEINASIDLPAEFSLKASSGGAVTSQLTYYSQGPSPSGSGSGGGGGGSGPENPCLETLPPSCHPVYFQTTRHSTNARGERHARVSSWDSAARAHVGPVARAADAFSCPQALLGAPQLFLGGLSLQNVSLTCDSSAKYPWTGTADLDFSWLPGGESLPSAQVTFRLDANGKFVGGNADLNPGAPGMPVFATPPVSLLALDIGIGTHPTDFDGQATIDILGGLVQIDGGVLVVNADRNDPYTYDATSCNQGLQCPPLPGVDSLQWSGPINTFAAGVGGTVTIGDVPLLGSIKLAGGYVFYIYPSYLEFAGQLGPLTLGPLSFTAGLRGAFDTGTHQYDASANVDGCLDLPVVGNVCAGLDGEVSNVGVGVCVGGGDRQHGCSGPCGGFTYQWGGEVNFIGSLTGSCDFTPIVVVVHGVRRAAAAQAAGSVGFDLPPGLPGADVYVDGVGGPPRFEVTGPKGQQLSNPVAGQPVRSGDLMLWPLPQLDQTMIVIKDPAGGRWTLTPLPGSPSITSVSYARQLASPEVSIRVSDPGGAFTLHYQLAPRAGRTVQFVERGRGVFHVLGRARGGRGSLRFAPALGPAGGRQIVAIVADGGLPVRTLVVGRYTAPPIPRAGTVRRVRILRAGRTLVVSWPGAANAHGYLVSAELSDGRRLSYTVRGRRLAIRTFAPGTSAGVTVYGIGPTGVLGAGASARLAPPAPPTRITGIRVRRTSKGLVIGWRPAARAIRYMLRITVTGPSPAVLFAITDRPSLAPKNASVMLGVGSDSLIAIRGVSLEGQQGRAGVLRYLAKTKGRTRHRRALLELFQ